MKTANMYVRGHVSTLNRDQRAVTSMKAPFQLRVQCMGHYSAGREVRKAGGEGASGLRETWLLTLILLKGAGVTSSDSAASLPVSSSFSK